MKSFTRSSILKSTTVEMTSPRVLQCTDMESKYKKQAVQGVPADFPVLSLAMENHSDTGTTSKPSASSPSAMEKEQAEVLAIFSQAKAEAQQIIAEAKRQAKELLETAQIESENYIKAYQQTLREEIIPKAKAEGFEKGLQEAAEEAKRIRTQAKSYLEIAKRVLMDEYQVSDAELIGLCIKISEKILHSTLHIDPTKLLSVIRSLSLMPMEKEGMKIHLSPEDAEWYKELSKDDKPSYPYVVDDTLKKGDVFLECAEGIFDARINSQLEKINHYLLEELERGRLDGVSEES